MRVSVVYFDWEKAEEMDEMVLALVKGNFHGKERPDLYKTISSIDIEAQTKTECAEKVFCKFNDCQGTNRRSFSVGDLVAFDDKTAMLCKPIGWQEIQLPENFPG